MVRGSLPHTSPPGPCRALTVFACLRSGRLHRLRRGYQRRAWLCAARDQRAAVSGMQTADLLAMSLIGVSHAYTHARHSVLSIASPQVDNERYVGFVNKVSDPAARLLTSRYSHEQLAYFGALVRVRRCGINVVLSSMLFQHNDSRPPSQSSSMIQAGCSTTK